MLNYITLQTVVNGNNVKMKFNIFRGGKLIVCHQKVSNHYILLLYYFRYLIFPLQTFMKKKPQKIHQ